MKTIHLVTLTTLLALGIALAPGSASAHSAAGAITVVDDHGTTVMLARPALRIVALAPNVVEILYAIGAGNRVVGVSQDTDYPAAAIHKPVVVTFTAVNLEKILALHPDLLIAAGIDARFLPKLRSLHLPTAVFDPTTIGGILHDIALAGALTGTYRAAQQAVARLQARAARVTERIGHTTARPRVYYEYDFSKSGGYTYGRNSFGDALITMAGGENIGRAGAGPYPLLSAEKVIGLDPQVIVLADAAFGVSAASVARRPGFAAIVAVQQHRIYPFNDTLVSRPGPRIVDGLEALARLLHPEAFR